MTEEGIVFVLLNSDRLSETLISARKMLIYQRVNPIERRLKWKQRLLRLLLVLFGKPIEYARPNLQGGMVSLIFSWHCTLSGLLLQCEYEW